MKLYNGGAFGTIEKTAAQYVQLCFVSQMDMFFPSVSLILCSPSDIYYKDICAYAHIKKRISILIREE